MKRINIQDGIICIAENIEGKSPTQVLKEFDKITKECLDIAERVLKPCVELSCRISDYNDGLDKVKYYGECYGRQSQEVAKFFINGVLSQSLVLLNMPFASFSIHNPINIKNRIDAIEQIGIDAAKDLPSLLAKCNAAINNAVEYSRRALNQSTIIASPTLAAVIANDINSAKVNRGIETGQNMIIQACADAIQIIFDKIAQFSNLLSAYKKLVSDVRGAFVSSLVSLEGTWSNRPLWNNIIKNPFAIDNYVIVIESIQSVAGLAELMVALDINRVEVFRACIQQLKAKCRNGKIIVGLSTNERFINNLSVLFEKDKPSIARDIFEDIQIKVQKRIRELSNQLPRNAIEGLKSGKNIHTCSKAAAEEIISKEEYIVYYEKVGSILQGTMLNACKLGLPYNSSPDEVYDAFVDYIAERLEDADIVAKQMKKELDALEKEKKDCETELEAAGLLAFMKKKKLNNRIEELRKKIREKTYEYNQKLEKF